LQNITDNCNDILFSKFTSLQYTAEELATNG